jgi:hypothetical protein
LKRINFRNLQKLLKRDIVIAVQLDCTDTSTSKRIQSVDNVDVIQNHETSVQVVHTELTLNTANWTHQKITPVIFASKSSQKKSITRS